MAEIIKKHNQGRLWEISEPGSSNFVEDKSLVSDILDKYRDNFPMVYGVPRSGSTLIHNILNTIFDGNIEVQKHYFFKTNNKVIVAYRDFRDSTASNWRINKAGFDKEEDKKVVGFDEMLDSANRIKRQVHDNLNQFKEYYSDEALFMCYEQYHEDFDFLLDKLEKFLDIKIKPKLREFINKTWNKKRIKRVYSDSLEAFMGYDKATEIHGQHIYKGAVGTWKEFLVEEDHCKMNEFFKDELKHWEYTK